MIAAVIPTAVPSATPAVVATSTPILDGLSFVDTTGRIILAATVVSLIAGISAHVVLRGRYAALDRDLADNADAPRFEHRVLNRIVDDAQRAARRSRDVNTQAIIEDGFHAELKPLLLAERFVRAATGLVIILGLLGTFYGLTLSIGKLVHLVTADSATVADVPSAVTHGLTQALEGMAVAFSNSLVGILSAVVLTILGFTWSVADRRTALMVRLETYLDARLPAPPRAAGDAGTFAESVARLDGAVARFDAALRRFSADTKDLREIELVVALKPGGTGGRGGAGGAE